MAVSAVSGAGLTELRTALDAVLSRLPAPCPAARVRLWVDRAFSITGAGTVATGTLTAGTLARGDRLTLLGRGHPREVTVRGLQSCGHDCATLSPAARVAVNLRGLPAEDVHRGNTLVTVDAWPITDVLDVRRTTGLVLNQAPEHLVVHVGTASAPARLRPFDDDHARLSLEHPLPLTLSDQLLLRDPGGRRILAGVRVLDPDPPGLRRRGDSTRRAVALAALAPGGDPAAVVADRGAVPRRRLQLLGYDCAAVPAGVREIRGWWVHTRIHRDWVERLGSAVRELHDRNPLSAGLSGGAAADLLGLPDAVLLDDVVRDCGLEFHDGLIRVAGTGGDLGPAEAAVAALESRLAAEPFRAPGADDLTALRLGVRELAAAERAGRLLRLTDSVVLLPSAPALAMRELALLAQPFTATQAKQTLHTTRRVAIPLLEYLDARGWTRRIDNVQREVVR